MPTAPSESENERDMRVVSNVVSVVAVETSAEAGVLATVGIVVEIEVKGNVKDGGR